ncbi:MAG: hypothetical protein E7179_02865 [Erysipelotrichaceae bacterium]|jgi:uncharacterized protein YrzB (UPF0473 family)|nr:hypothetical protein [Erysipelotrichaceae bacterium]
MAETITLYDQNGNETVFDKHFETKIRGVIYDIFTIQGREDEGGFVFKATPLNRHGEFNYEICMDQSIVQEVFARFRQQGGVEEEPPSRQGSDELDIPKILYVPWECDSSDTTPENWPDMLEIVSSMRYKGDCYLISVVRYDTGTLERGTPVVFEVKDVATGRRGESGTTYDVVDDYYKVSEIVEAYKKVDRSALRNLSLRENEFGALEEGQTMPMEDKNGKIYMMSQMACIDLEGARYFMLAAAYDLPGVGSDTAIIYQLRRDDKGTRYLELILDQRTTEAVMNEYHRLEDFGLGMHSKDDDDIF